MQGDDSGSSGGAQHAAARSINDDSEGCVTAGHGRDGAAADAGARIANSDENSAAERKALRHRVSRDLGRSDRHTEPGLNAPAAPA